MEATRPLASNLLALEGQVSAQLEARVIMILLLEIMHC